jgi:hypothetical protein
MAPDGAQQDRGEPSPLPPVFAVVAGGQDGVATSEGAAPAPAEAEGSPGGESSGSTAAQPPMRALVLDLACGQVKIKTGNGPPFFGFMPALSALSLTSGGRTPSCTRNTPSPPPPPPREQVAVCGLGSGSGSPQSGEDREGKDGAAAVGDAPYLLCALADHQFPIGMLKVRSRG